jgi:hypothetical protein
VKITGNSGWGYCGNDCLSKQTICKLFFVHHIFNPEKGGSWSHHKLSIVHQNILSPIECRKFCKYQNVLKKGINIYTFSARHQVRENS